MKIGFRYKPIYHPALPVVLLLSSKVTSEAANVGKASVLGSFEKPKK